MLIHYILLGVTPESSDEEIRTRYLDLVKQYSPEKYPIRFQEINAAYEAVKDIRKRLAGLYLPPKDYIDPSKAVTALTNALIRTRKRVGLKELIQNSELRASS